MVSHRDDANHLRRFLKQRYMSVLIIPTLLTLSGDYLISSGFLQLDNKICHFKLWTTESFICQLTGKLERGCPIEEIIITPSSSIPNTLHLCKCGSRSAWLRDGYSGNGNASIRFNII